MEKFYSESCLLEQAFIKDAGKTIGDLVSEASAKTGENVSRGEPLAVIHFNSDAPAREAQQILKDAFSLNEHDAPRRKLIIAEL